MTLTEARTKATEAQATLRRLDALVAAKPHSNSVQAYQHQLRSVLQGNAHELETLRSQLADLVGGLSGIGPARNGQIGGQRQGGHATSASALDLVAPKVGTQRSLLLLRLWDDTVKCQRMEFPDGLTDVELASVSNLPANSVRPRRVELVDAGWLRDSGRTRQHNGRDHTVWSLTDAARERLQNGDTET